jgi:hypothetical protein
MRRWLRSVDLKSPKNAPPMLRTARNTRISRFAPRICTRYASHGSHDNHSHHNDIGNEPQGVPFGLEVFPSNPARPKERVVGEHVVLRTLWKV